MKNIKTYEGFLSGIFGKKGKEEVKKNPEEKYKELVGLIIDFVYDKESEFHLSQETFNVCKKELKELGKWEEFKNSKEYNDEFKKRLYKKLLLEIKPLAPSGNPIFDLTIFNQCEEELKEIGKWEEFLNSGECSDIYNKCVKEISENYGEHNAMIAHTYIERIGKMKEFMESKEGKIFRSKAEAFGKTNRGDYLNHGPYGFDPKDIENY
jgi:hypothetical protein